MGARIGAAFNEHWHCHCCDSDGVFVAADEQVLAFVPATVDAERVARVQARVRRRVLVAYCRQGVLRQDAQDMAGWDHGGGFSGDMTRQQDLWIGRSRHPDMPVDVMPDYENQNQDLVW